MKFMMELFFSKKIENKFAWNHLHFFDKMNQQVGILVFLKLVYLWRTTSNLSFSSRINVKTRFLLWDLVLV